MAIKLIPTQTIALLNAIRADASKDFQERVPVVTEANIKEYGASLQNDKRLYNEFVDCLIGRIGMTIIGSQNFKNNLAKFKKGQLPFGDTIQDVFVDVAKSEGVFDPDGANVLARSKDEAICYYHKVDRKNYYKKSISREQLLGAFLSVQKIGDFISAQFNSLYSGAEWDEYLATIELLGQFKPFVEEYAIPDLLSTINTSNLTGFVKTLRKAYKDLQFMSRKHNYAGVARKSDPAELTLFIRKDISAELDVEVLASAFNMDKTTLMGMVTEVETFGSFDDYALDGDHPMLSTKPVMAMLVDNEILQIYDQLVEMASILNPKGLFENYFYHIWQVLSMRKFANAIYFTTSPDVTINVLAGSTSKVAYAEYAYTYTDKDGATQNAKVRFDTNKDGSGVTVKLANIYKAGNKVSLYTKDGTKLTSATISTAVDPAGTSVASNVSLSSGELTIPSGHTFDTVPSYITVTLN